MGVMHKNTASGAGVVNPAASAETVIYTTPNIQVGAGDGLIAVTGTVNITPGATTTALVIRVRQGSLTGPLVGQAATHTVAAAAPQSISFGATDSSGAAQAAGGIPYVVTVAQTGGTGAGTTNFVDIEVLT